MGFFRELFGPSKKEVWKQLSREIGAEFVDGGFLQGCRVEARVDVWTITLDTYTLGSEDRLTYTRIRAPYVSADGFWFKIYRASPFSGLGKYLGMQDVEVGDAELDRDFMIQGNDAHKLALLFRSPHIRTLIMAQPHNTFEVKDGELHFEEDGVITDVERLKQLYALFAETLHQLRHVGSAYERDPGHTPGS